jgi:hypothetical protein
VIEASGIVRPSAPDWPGKDRYEKPVNAIKPVDEAVIAMPHASDAIVSASEKK